MLELLKLLIISFNLISLYIFFIKYNIIYYMNNNIILSVGLAMIIFMIHILDNKKISKSITELENNNNNNINEKIAPVFDSNRGIDIHDVARMTLGVR